MPSPSLHSRRLPLPAWALLALWTGPACMTADDDAVGEIDTDEDGLSDSQEEALGTDPNDTDTDDDGYSDFEESHAGTDPLDEDSVIYTGGWPYNPGKNSIDDPGFDADGDGEIDAGGLGDTVPRLVAMDQFGDEMDLYDLAGQGVPVALDLSTGWCAPCQAVAAWLEGSGDISDYVWYDESYEIVPELVNSGQVLWITILYEDADHDDATPELAVSWYETYPHPLIPVVVDEDKEMHGWIRPSGIPNVNMLDEDMTLTTYSDRGLEDAFAAMVEQFGD